MFLYLTASEQTAKSLIPKSMPTPSSLSVSLQLGNSTHGRYSQEQIDFMMSHINSYSRKKLGNKSPYEVFEFQYGRKILDAFHLQKIPAGEIILSPELLK